MKVFHIAQIVHRHLCLDHTLLLYHIATPRTPSTKYIHSALLFAIKQIPKCLREIDRQLNDYILIDSQFLHNTNINFLFI